MSRQSLLFVPPGQYVVGMWHPKLIAQSKPVTIEVSKPLFSILFERSWL